MSGLSSNFVIVVTNDSATCILDVLLYKTLILASIPLTVLLRYPVQWYTGGHKRYVVLPTDGLGQPMNWVRSTHKLGPFKPRVGLSWVWLCLVFYFVAG